MIKSDVLVIIAHPDDEVFASGTICLCAEKRLRITMVCVTDGDNGSRELLERVEPNLELGEVRCRELALSAWVLGATEVVFLRQADISPTDWGGAVSWDQPQLIDSLTQIIRRTDPELILTHGPLGGYGHPAHREVNACVMAAARMASFSESIFSFCGQVKHAFFSWRFDDPSTVLIDASDFLRRRSASLSYHQSQSEFFLSPYFPHTFRKLLSALFGFALAFTVTGRKRVVIATPARFFKRYPIEGLVLRQAPPDGRRHFFLERFANDRRVRTP
jgi:LmbE family N-acetylglucosaminyl deacetylase